MYIQKFLYTPFTPTQTYPYNGNRRNRKKICVISELKIGGRREICPPDPTDQREVKPNLRDPFKFQAAQAAKKSV